MKILLLGASLDSLLLASMLQSKGHDVTLIEIEAEIGLPLHHPGRVIDVGLLSNYFSQEQLDFLSLKENLDGWGCRWEWILKHMAHSVVLQGVVCLLRTRVLDIQKNDSTYQVLISDNERDLPTHLVVDKVIDMERQHSTRPGRLTHVQSPSNIMKYPFSKQEPWFGGMALTSIVGDQQTSADLTLEHADGLVELWWRGNPPWEPKNGFIETCNIDLPSLVSEISFDAIVQRVDSFLLHIV